MKTDVKVVGAELYFIPALMRVPLKFGNEVMESITCARAKVVVETADGSRAEGWGETPLSVGWTWPGSKLTFEFRDKKMRDFCEVIAKSLSSFEKKGHVMEIGHEFIENNLDSLLAEFNNGLEENMPHLSALVCLSPFDIAIHDAYGNAHNVPVYDTYNEKYMNYDLSHYLIPAEDTTVSFKGKYPCDFFVEKVPSKLPVWHLVGGKDLLTEAELTGNEPDDGYPVILEDWLSTDGLNCLKIKLCGNDQEADYERLVAVGKIAEKHNVDWLSTDFNCMVTSPDYVNEILDRLVIENSDVFRRILYVEQPFPYDLENNQIDVHSVSARKPLFMDESAHDWRFVKLGRKLGWTGVALKVCKTQTGALLSMCWAKAHGMTLMVQDLTNPMLAVVPHVLLAAYSGTIMGVECNAPQFYPAASDQEAKVHPYLYARRNGVVDFSTLEGSGFAYREGEISRELPDAACKY
jgi:L-alanine-DL-glutamate epimerase-like enolase superfamily enzyme